MNSEQTTHGIFKVAAERRAYMAGLYHTLLDFLEDVALVYPGRQGNDERQLELMVYDRRIDGAAAFLDVYTDEYKNGDTARISKISIELSASGAVTFSGDLSWDKTHDFKAYGFDTDFCGVPEAVSKIVYTLNDIDGHLTGPFLVFVLESDPANFVHIAKTVREKQMETPNAPAPANT